MCQVSPDDEGAGRAAWAPTIPDDQSLDGAAGGSPGLRISPQPVDGTLCEIGLSEEAVEALAVLEARDDRDARMMKRLLALPDLSRCAASPVGMTIERILRAQSLAGFDQVVFPEVVSVHENFDVLLVPDDHPARSTSDTYYLTDNTVLRTHTTTMWPYYMSRPETHAELEANGVVRALSYGKCYRRDEIDRFHHACFHQIDGLLITERSTQTFGEPELEGVFRSIARSLYGPDVECEARKDTFPFTDPSLELFVRHQGEMLEVVGGGIVRNEVLDLFGIDSRRYNGWAFGFGVDRLAMVKMQLPDIRLLWSADPRVTSQFQDWDSVYTPISRYPATYRDISFIVPTGFNPNLFFDLVREETEGRRGEGIVEQVQLMDRFESPKFGPDRVSYTYRVIYCSHERTLENAEVDEIQFGIRAAVVDAFQVELRGPIRPQ